MNRLSTQQRILGSMTKMPGADGLADLIEEFDVGRVRLIARSFPG